ncbi:hypothetical protein [Bradyrhizobium neotropicale]|uniref:hypothetical protein n=1 Tax=Bradyrhizobium neotropicale TaxID=1497615 RepID=UPI000B0CC50A|nr:hypothetical protein [Bradyrhizobium neotropicale]
MTTPAVCSALIGLALGIRFRFFVVLPLLFLGSIALTTLSIVQKWPQAQALWSTVLFAAALQAGYVLSALLKHTIGPATVEGGTAPIGNPKLR